MAFTLKHLSTYQELRRAQNVWEPMKGASRAEGHSAPWSHRIATSASRFQIQALVITFSPWGCLLSITLGWMREAQATRRYGCRTLNASLHLNLKLNMGFIL